MPETRTADEWRRALREDLRDAMKRKDRHAVAGLRSALSAIDNAEVPGAAAPPPPVEGAIAGAVAFGASEVDRRALSRSDLDSIVRGEVAERKSAAAEYREHGHEDRGAALLAEAAAIERHL